MDGLGLYRCREREANKEQNKVSSQAVFECAEHEKYKQILV